MKVRAEPIGGLHLAFQRRRLSPVLGSLWVTRGFLRAHFYDWAAGRASEPPDSSWRFTLKRTIRRLIGNTFRFETSLENVFSDVVAIAMDIAWDMPREDQHDLTMPNTITPSA